MNWKWKTATGLGLALTCTVFAITFEHTVTGTLDQFPFPAPPGTGPGGFIQIQTLELKQGETTGWHHHDGPAWVILKRGRGVVEFHACGSVAVTPGAAFVEPQGYVHKVDNNGPGEATITWATVYPQGSTPIVPDDGPPPCTP